MSLQEKGFYAYAYPEVTNILMGQVPFDFLYTANTTANVEYHAGASGTNDSNNIYLPNTDAWCAFKVISWNSASQLIGGICQARCLEGFPGDDFSRSGTYAGSTAASNISLVAGDVITGVFDKISIRGTAALQPTAVLAYRISL